MANFFDQYDEKPASNFFDQFDYVAKEEQAPVEEPGLMDRIGSAMNYVRDFATGANPKKESVLQGLQMESPAGMTDDVDLEANRSARDRSRSPKSVMFTKANAVDTAKEQTDDGSEILKEKQELIDTAESSRDVGTIINDAWSAYASGSAGLVGMPVNLVAPSSDLGKYLRGARKSYEEQQSPEMKARNALMKERIDNEDGFVGKYAATLYSLASDPTLGLNEVIKQVPNFVGIIGASKFGSLLAGGAVDAAGVALPGTVGIGEAISGGALKAAAQSAAAGASGVGSSVLLTAGDAAGNTYEDLIRTPLDVWRKNPDFQALVESGVSAKEAIQQIATTKSRIAAIAAAPLGLLGYAGAESSMIASMAAKKAGTEAGKQGFVKILVKDLLGENIEEGGTQYLSNLATRQVDASKDAMEGVAQAAATATIASGPMSGIAAYNETSRTPKVPEQSYDYAGLAAQKLSPVDILKTDTVDSAVDAFTVATQPNITARTDSQEQNGTTTGVLPTDPTSAGQTSAAPLQSMGDGATVGERGSVDTGTMPSNPVDQPRQLPSQVPTGAVDQNAPTTTESKQNTVNSTSTVEQTTANQTPAPVASNAAATTVVPGTGNTTVQTSVVNPIARTSDADLLSRVEQAGVVNEATTVRNSVNLEDAGGNAGGSQAATVPTGLAGVADTAGRGTAYSGKQSVGDSAAARTQAQKTLDYWHGRDSATHPKIVLGDPDAQADAQIQGAMRQAKEVFGVSANVVAFSDPSPDSVNGIQIGNTVYINTKGLTSNALNTGWHETHHVMQAMKEADDRAGKTNTPAQRYISKVDAIFDTMSDAGKRSYIENFLFKDRLSGLSGQQREAAIKNALTSKETRKEMMADFVGNRATDRAFIVSLAKADPKNFSQWAAKWIQTINDLIADLRGVKSSKSESDAVDKYVRDLQKAKLILRDAMVQLRREGVVTQSASTDIDYSRKGVIGEVAPNPDKPVAKEWDSMDGSEKTQANRDVGRRVAQAVMDEMGLKGWSVTFSSGTYEGKTNPNFIIEAPDSATQAQINEFAKLVGYVLDQKAMVTFDESNTTDENLSGFVKVVLPAGMPESKVKELRAKIGEVAKSAGDDTLRDGALVFGNYRGEDGKPFSGIEDTEFGNQIAEAVAEFDYDGGTVRVSEVERYASALIWPDNRDDYLKGTRYESSEIQSSAGGEFFSGTGKGAISLDSANLQKTQPDADKTGSTTAPVGANVSVEIEKFWQNKLQETLAQENASTAQQANTQSKL